MFVTGVACVGCCTFYLRRVSPEWWHECRCPSQGPGMHILCMHMYIHACIHNLHMYTCMYVLKHSYIAVTNALTHAYTLTGSVPYDDRTSSYPGSTPRGRHPSLRHRQEGWCVCLCVWEWERERKMVCDCAVPATDYGLILLILSCCEHFIRHCG